MSTPDVRIAPNKTLIVLLALSIVAGLAWGYRHLYLILTDQHYEFMGVFLVMFVLIVWQLVLAWREKPYTVTPHQQRRLNQLRVIVNVPVYNEDPAIVHRTITALFEQSRLPDRIEVIDDGSKTDYTTLKSWWERHDHKGVEFRWHRQANGGKRSAQIATFSTAKADIYVTIDSDTALHKDAIAEGLKPFADPDIMSVAGLEIGLNRNQNLLVKTLDMVVNNWQMNTRSALGTVGNVLTNSGPLAFYRASVIRDSLDGYANETLLGRKIEFSDDSQLTLYSLMEGKTVQQISSVGFTMRPEKFGHIVRQQVRWCRGMFIRSLWRYKYLPLNGWGFWYELVVNWLQFFASMAVFAYLFIYTPVIDGRIIWLALLIAPLLTYILTLRTLIIRRSDETTWQWFSNWLLSPMIILWGWFFFRPIRLYGMVTFWKTGWGTRASQETLSV